MPKWTKEQQQVIQQRGKSMLVAAGAGSGKTAVLVERIIQMISDEANPVNIDSLLIVTFTNAAAAEMKERIGVAIQNALLENPLSEHLYRQSLFLQKAQITTLHSFCLDLVRQNFFKLGIDPNLKIADETENQLLLAETIDEVLELHYTDSEHLDEFITLVDRYGGKEDEQLRKIIIRLYQMAQSMAEPIDWLQSVISQEDIDWFKEAEADILHILDAAKALLVKAIKTASDDDGLYGYMNHIELEYNWICELQACFEVLEDSEHLAWENCRLRLQSGGFKRLPAVKKNTCDEILKAQVTEYRDNAKALLQKMQLIYFSRSKEELNAEIALQEPFRKQLCTLTQELITRFQEKKAEKNRMDFHDMEHFCYRLLYEKQTDGTIMYSELATELQSSYTEVLVDEYQDINDLQESILQAVSREDNLFMVGDIKQSIYGFRMANPGLFAKKYNEFPKMDTCVRIDLNKNFRCRTSVVDGVNQIFTQIMSGQNGDLEYDENAALIYGAEYPQVSKGMPSVPDKLYLHIITEQSQIELTADDSIESVMEKSDEQSLTTMEIEGMVICQEIQQLMMEPAQVFDKNIQGYRDITLRDIVVLLRAPKTVGAVYARILNEHGIPAAVDAGDGYFTAWEIQILTAMLHIIDNPLQDIPLLAVMRAPFFAFTEDELALLRMVEPKQYFYQCIVTASQSNTVAETLQIKCTAFLDMLQKWRSISLQLSLSQLIWRLYKDTGIYEYVGTLRDGLQRQANLRALHDRAKTYEQTSFKGVFMFLRFLQQLEQNQADLEPAKILSDNDNVVRIMSIHKSKGLEFPVVFVGGMGQKFNQTDAQQDFLLDKDYGIAFSTVDDLLEIRYKTIAQHIISRKKRLEALHEEKRVLYVAMTRARERLYMIGSCSKPDKRSAINPEQASCYLDWFIPLIKQGIIAAPLWQVIFQDNNQVSNNAKEENKDEKIIRHLLEDDDAFYEPGKWYQSIDAQLSWNYEKADFTHIKAQSSVTELKKNGQSSDHRFHFDARPEVVKAKESLTGAEKGTLLHLILNHVDLDCEVTETYLYQLLYRLEREQYIPCGLEDEVDLQGVLAFFQDDLGKRLVNASPKYRYREMPFIVALDANVIDAALPKGEKSILVQGIIDCMWKEADGWVLVDYKSDHILPYQTELIYERYGNQIKLYRYAVEKILGEPVKEAYFFLTSVGIALKV